MKQQDTRSSTGNADKNVVRHRIKFLALIGVFLSPFIAGWMALYVFDLKPTAGNYGTLVSPVRKLDWPDLENRDGEVLRGGFGRKWVLLIVANDDCGELCRSNLFYMRQLRTLLGRNTLRLQNVLVTGQPLSAEMKQYLAGFPNLEVIENNRDPALYRLFELDGLGEVGSEPRMYLVDPDQNLMMHYPAQPDADLMLDDIRKLMKLSQIG